MSEEIRDDAGGATPPVENTAAPAAEQKTLAEAGAVDLAPEAVAQDQVQEPPKAAWPEDWRDQMAGGDDKVKNLLNRYTSPDALAKAFKELRAAYDSRKPEKAVPDLPKDATPEQIAEYRKAIGVPETPDDYEFEVPEGREIGDGELEIFKDFAKSMHEKNIPKDVVKNISGWFMEYQETLQQRNADLAYQRRTETEERLRAEWGGDYRANVNLMSNVLQEHLGSNAPAFLSQQLMDGSRIGDNENFIRLMADLARKVGGSSAELYTSDVATTATSLETRKADLMKMMNDPDPIVRKKYWSPSVQEELTRIQTALVRRAS